MILTYSPIALAALDAIYAYHEETDRPAACRIADRITFSARMIEKFPFMAPEAHDGTQQFSVPRTPYRMIYQVDGDAVIVLERERMQHPRTQ